MGGIESCHMTTGNMEGEVMAVGHISIIFWMGAKGRSMREALEGQASAWGIGWVW